MENLFKAVEVGNLAEVVHSFDKLEVSPTIRDKVSNQDLVRLCSCACVLTVSTVLRGGGGGGGGAIWC